MIATAAGLLRRARLDARLTQSEMAARAGVSQSVISAYESGRREPAFSTVQRLLGTIDVELRVILQPKRRGRLRSLVDTHRDELVGALAALGASNPRLFGSAARGDDTASSDVDLMVDLSPDVSLFGLAHMRSEASRILGVDVDIVPADGLKAEIRRSARADLIPL